MRRARTPAQRRFPRAAALLALAVLLHSHGANAAPPAAAAGGPCRPAAASYRIAMPGHPFAVLPSADEQHAFVSVQASNPRTRTGIAVLACRDGRFVPVQFVPLESQPSGMALTHDGKLLIAADDEYVVFVDTARAIAGRPAIAGYFRNLEDDDAGAVYANVTPDDRFAFVSDENNATITVIDLAKARANGFTRASIVGAIPVGNAPIALTFTADARFLLTTSQRPRRSENVPPACKPEGADPATAAVTVPPGQIVVIDVQKAQTDPAHAVTARIPAGCSPVRMSLAPDGATAWVTARNSNAVLGFSVPKLVAGDAGAQIVSLPAGAAPVPVLATADGTMVLAGNSNRFGLGAKGDQTLSVFDAREAANGRSAALGQLAVGRFPRELTRTASGSLIFLSNWDSDDVMVFDAARLRQLVH